MPFACLSEKGPVQPFRPGSEAHGTQITNNKDGVPAVSLPEWHSLACPPKGFEWYNRCMGISNPAFHQKLKLAVALKYRQDEDVSPLVVASGKGALAQALVKKAVDLGVPIHPDGELAELLSEVEVGQSIPEELYEVVAQVMAMVYRMDAELGRGRR